MHNVRTNNKMDSGGLGQAAFFRRATFTDFRNYVRQKQQDNPTNPLYLYSYNNKYLHSTLLKKKSDIIFYPYFWGLMLDWVHCGTFLHIQK